MTRSAQQSVTLLPRLFLTSNPGSPQTTGLFRVPTLPPVSLYILTSVVSSMMVRPAAARLASGLNGAFNVPSMKLWCEVATRARSLVDGVTL